MKKKYNGLNFDDMKHLRAIIKLKPQNLLSI